MDDLTTSPAFKAAQMYEDFLVPGIFKYWTPVLLDKAAPMPGEQVLDVACGTGMVARSVVPIVTPGGKVSGLDKNPAMLAVACRQYSSYCDEVDWREGFAESLPYPDCSFDLVLCQQGIQFFNDRRAAASEMRRVLRPGGRALVEVWQVAENNPFWLDIYQTISPIIQVPVSVLSSGFAYGDADELDDLLQSVGFERVQVDQVALQAHFSEPGHFIEKAIRAIGAVVPDFAQLDARLQTGLLDDLKQATQPTINAHINAGVLTIPTCANIATAR